MANHPNRGKKRGERRDEPLTFQIVDPETGRPVYHHHTVHGSTDRVIAYTAKAARHRAKQLVGRPVDVEEIS
jgi:hypothetical protein